MDASSRSQLSVLSQVLFDILPLRLVPPLMFGGIVYGLVGLVPTVAAFWKFILILVLFNLTTASVVLLLSIAFSSISVASLVGTLVMLFKCVLNISWYFTATDVPTACSLQVF
jgi:ABC-type transport system involved in multi-copper enzyme maturation permease subunit